MKDKVRLKDIAKKLNLSPSTISQAFNNPTLINIKTRDKIYNLCSKLEYKRKSIIRRRNKNIAILSESPYTILGSPYNSITAGILKSAKINMIDILLGIYEPEEESLPSLIMKKIVDGVIIIGKFQRNHALKIIEERFPVVICGNPISGLELHTITADGRSGIYKTTKHLIELGHEKIATITGGPISDPIISDRLDGYRFALSEANIKVPNSYIVPGNYHDLTSIKCSIETIMSLKNKPSAIVCFYDAVAYTVIKVLKEKGLKVPKDISVTGFDNLPFPEFIESIKPQLTTAHVNLEKLGETAFDILLDIIEKPTRIVHKHTIPTQLIVRETTTRK